MTLFNVALLLLFGLAPVQGSVSQSDVLDLTKEAQRNLSVGPSSTDLGARGSSHGPMPERLIQLVASRVDENLAQLGGRVVVEVKLTNTGKFALVIPWSDDLDRIASSSGKNRRPSGFQSGLVQLAFRDSEGNQYVSSGRDFYGAESVPASLKTVLPGKSVILRAAIPVEFTDSDARRQFLKSIPSRQEIRVSLTILDSDGALTATSSNSIAIVFTK